MKYPTTPDARYFVVRGRLWRLSNPHLDADRRNELVGQLMDARRAIRAAKATEELARARRMVDEAKIALGERGSPWWQDGAPDLNRHLVRNTPYGDWYDALPDSAKVERKTQSTP